MSTPPTGISQADWLATPASVKEMGGQVQALREENEQLRLQLTAQATELAGLRERLGRNSRNSSKPPSSDGQGFKMPARRKGSGRQRGGQQGHPGSGPELLPIERCDDVVDNHLDACRRCGTLLQGDDPEPSRHQVIEIPPITAQVTCHRLHRLICPCCGTSTFAEFPAEVEQSRYGPRLSALVGLLGSAFSLSLSHTQSLLDQLLGVSISSGAYGLRPTASTPPSPHAWPNACSNRWRKRCRRHGSSRWCTWMKPAPPLAMRMAAIPMAVAAGCGC